MREFTTVVFSYNLHQYLLPYCLRSIRKNLPNLSQVVLVWDDNVDWYPMDFDKLRKTTGVDFQLVLQSELYSWPESIIHFGWVKQQLAKLRISQHIGSDFCWIVDGDVLITGDPELFDHDRPILRMDQDRPVFDDYKFFMQKYLNINQFGSHTFVGSTALFERNICESIEKQCLDYSGLSILDAVDHMLTTGSRPTLPFSEFEIYGHQALSVHKEIVVRNRNWNYVIWNELDFSLPIQIAWAEDPSQDIEERYTRLINHVEP